MENKFKRVAYKITEDLRKVGVNCHISSYSKNNNSIYIRLGNLDNDYDCIRISDHNGKNITRFSLRIDLNQSKKLKVNGKEFKFYCFNDIQGMLKKVRKEYA
jgi:hypothetical protein